MNTKHFPLEIQLDIEAIKRMIDNLDIDEARQIAKEYYIGYRNMEYIAKEVLKKDLLENASFIIY
jgi:hypothetical protein